MTGTVAALDTGTMAAGDTTMTGYATLSRACELALATRVTDPAATVAKSLAHSIGSVP
jgi:hypothetical protein